MRSWTLAIAIALVASPGCSPRDPEDTEEDLGLTEVGQPYFVKYCAPCHGIGGQGDGPEAKELPRRPADLTALTARYGRFPADDVAAYIDGRSDVAAHGARSMPTWGERFSRAFSADYVGESVARGKIGVIVEYVRSIQADRSGS